MKEEDQLQSVAEMRRFNRAVRAIAVQIHHYLSHCQDDLENLIVTYHIIAFFVLSDKKIVRPRPILLTKHILNRVPRYNLGYLHVIASEGHGKLFSWEIICFSDL